MHLKIEHGSSRHVLGQGIYGTPFCVLQYALFGEGNKRSMVTETLVKREITGKESQEIESLRAKNVTEKKRTERPKPLDLSSYNVQGIVLCVFTHDSLCNAHQNRYYC